MSVELRSIPLFEIRRSRYQPRTRFDEAALRELAQSLATTGLIEPVIVRDLPDENSRYELIAGERRWRAAGLAGLHEIPALVRDIDDPKAAIEAVVENVQREPLTPIEEARAYQRLREFDLTLDEIGAFVGRDKTSVSHTLRLLELDDEIQAMIQDGALSRGHAKALLGAHAVVRRGLAMRAKANAWSVRELERAVQREMPVSQKSASVRRDPNLRALEERIGEAFACPARVDPDPKGGCRITLRFYSNEELEGFLERAKIGSL